MNEPSAVASGHSRGPSLGHLFTLVFAVTGWVSTLGRLGDNSFFWHLRTGHWIIEHGIPRTDPYSFTAAGAPWVAQSWLAELAYAGIDRLVGPFGIRLFAAATGAAIAVVAFRLTFAIAGSRARAGILSIAALVASNSLWSIRPLLLGVLAMAVLVWLIELPDTFFGRRIAWVLPILMWLWANSHGTFMLGFAYLALHVLGRWADGAPPWRSSELVLVRAALVSLGVALLNPYGLALLTFPFELLSRGEILQYVTEWQSPDFRDPQGERFALWVAVFIGCAVFGRNRMTRRDFIVAAPFLLLGLWAQRNIALAPLVMLPIAARAIASAEVSSTEVSVDRVVVGHSGRLHRGMAAVVMMIALLGTIDARGKADFDFTAYPVRAMDVIEEKGLLGKRMATDDGWGGYVILEWWPRQRVFIDDRFDMYPTATIEDYLVLHRAGEGWRAVLKRWEIEVIVWRRDRPLAAALAESSQWERVYRDDQSVVYRARRPGDPPR